MDSCRSWVVRVKRSAKKELAGIGDRDAQRAISEKIAGFAVDPFPPGCRKVEGRKDTWRLRVGNYRVIYEIDDEILYIDVIKIGHRKDVYRGM